MDHIHIQDDKSWDTHSQCGNTNFPEIEGEEGKEGRWKEREREKERREREEGEEREEGRGGREGGREKKEEREREKETKRKEILSKTDVHYYYRTALKITSPQMSALLTALGHWGATFLL
jgi:hypothetical protein